MDNEQPVASAGSYEVGPQMTMGGGAYTLNVVMKTMTMGLSLMQAAGEYGEDHFDVGTQIYAVTCLGTLAREFRHMKVPILRSLKSLSHDLRRHNASNTNLGKVVESELATLS